MSKHPSEQPVKHPTKREQDVKMENLFSYLPPLANQEGQQDNYIAATMERIQAAAEQYPDQALRYLKNYCGLTEEFDIDRQFAWAPQRMRHEYRRLPDAFLEKIVTEAAAKAPLAALCYADGFAHEPYAGPILMEAAKQVPLAAVHYAHQYLMQPYASDVLKVADDAIQSMNVSKEHQPYYEGYIDQYMDRHQKDWQTYVENKPAATSLKR